MKLSIIFPAYNEEKRILPVLNNYYEFFNKKLKNNFEIIIIPNNCSDKTKDASENFAKNKKNIFVNNIPHYVGKGGAVIKGFKIARGEFIGFVDADESTIPEEFYKVFIAAQKFDGAIASRRATGSRVYPKRTLFKELSSWTFSLTTRILFGFKYKDTQCGAKIFKKHTANFLIENLSEFGWIFDVDLLYLCKKNKYKIKEIPITWRDSEGSKLIFSHQINSMLKLFKYWLKSFFKNPQ